MSKLKLEIESLQVESFTTAAGDAERGTVRGFDSDTSDLTAATRCFDCPPQLPGPIGLDGVPGDQPIPFPVQEAV